MSRIAIVGSGISGMSAAWLLSKDFEVWLYEREPRLGGHTHTHLIETSHGAKPIDTGFIVHNDQTYPNLVRLFAELGVKRQKSDMSFGVTDQKTGIEYSSRGLNGFFAVRKNLLRSTHYKLFAEMLRFNKRSAEWLQHSPDTRVTLGEYLSAERFSRDLIQLYLYPMACAVWSTSLDEIDQFPAFTLLQFFANHGFLTINQRPQWYVVEGGSSAYIAKITTPYKDRIVLNANIRSVCSGTKGPTIHLEDGTEHHFDHIVFACHGPQALALLADATQPEQEVLSAFRTTPNRVTLHTDEALLPKRKPAQASWNYRITSDSSKPTLTYDMNRLQNLDVPERYCVTLNDDEAIAPNKILRGLNYSHPLYTLAAVGAQQRWSEISNQRGLHFCGAYWFYGFHEDGLNSAIRVAQSLGVGWV